MRTRLLTGLILAGLAAVVATGVGCGKDDSSTSGVSCGDDGVCQSACADDPDCAGAEGGSAGSGGNATGGTGGAQPSGGGAGGSAGSGGALEVGGSGGNTAGEAGAAAVAGAAGDGGVAGIGGEAGVSGSGGTGGVIGSAGTAGSAGIGGSTGGSGGTGGTGGVGASGGTAGTAGSGASGGTGGIGASGGTGGTAGEAGSAGTAGDAGSAGSAGSAGAGGSGPSFVSDPVLTMNPNTRAPLAGTLTLETDRLTQLTVTVDNGIRPWTHTFDGYRTVHDEVVLGFYPSSTHTVHVTVTDQGGNPLSYPPLSPPQTPALPAGIPTLNVSIPEPSLMEPGVTMFAISKATANEDWHIVMLDEAGDIVWFYESPAPVWDLRRMANRNLLYNSENRYVYETDMLGNTVQMWETLLGSGAGGTPIATNTTHHEVNATATAFLTISEEVRSVAGYPTSESDLTPRGGSTDICADVFVEYAWDGTILNQWHLADLIDPTRVGYYAFRSTSVMGTACLEWSHSNGIIPDPSDDTIIVSVRHQDAVVKFNRSGEIQWILGPHENWTGAFTAFLLTPANPIPADFSWQFHQHAPALTEYGTLLLFDNGNGRASPPDPELADNLRYSRAVEYAIDEANMEVQLVWEYGASLPALYSPTVGDADWLPNVDNVLITFANLTTSGPGDNSALIREVTHATPAEIVFEVGVTDDRMVYRAERLPSLYP